MASRIGGTAWRRKHGHWFHVVCCLWQYYAQPSQIGHYFNFLFPFVFAWPVLVHCTRFLWLILLKRNKLLGVQSLVAFLQSLELSYYNFLEFTFFTFSQFTSMHTRYMYITSFIFIMVQQRYQQRNTTGQQLPIKAYTNIHKIVPLCCLIVQLLIDYSIVKYMK